MIDALQSAKAALLALLVSLSIAPASAQSAPPSLLARMQALEDSMSEAFNHCDIDKLASFYDPQLEFYHEGAGVTLTREKFLQNVKKNACNKFTRHMLDGTLQAWPLGKFGAVYVGSYQACGYGSDKCQVQGRVMMIVQRKGKDDWVITRVVSYDHKDLP